MNVTQNWQSDACDAGWTIDLHRIGHRITAGFRLCAAGLGELLAMSRPRDLSADDVSRVAESSDIKAARGGDQEAYRRLVERHQQEVGQYLWKFTTDRVAWDELLQTVFVEAYLSFAKFRGDSDFVDWLRGIATHVGYRFWTERKKQRDRRTSLPDLDDMRLVEPVRQPLGLFEMLEQLSPRDRLVLTLLYVEERSVADAARLAGWTESMVKSQAHRARIKLKELWEQADGQRGLAQTTGRKRAES